MEKAYQLAEKIVEKINDHTNKYMTEDGKDVICEDMIQSLNDIIESGLILYKYLKDKELYTGKPVITADMLELAKYIEKLAITEKNAKKLDMHNAMQIWNQTKIVIAVLACDLLDYRDNLN